MKGVVLTAMSKHMATVAHQAGVLSCSGLSDVNALRELWPVPAERVWVTHPAERMSG